MGAGDYRRERPEIHRIPMAGRSQGIFRIEEKISALLEGGSLSSQIAGHEIPIDQGPERFDITGAFIAVIDVIGMLPDIAGQKRNLIPLQRIFGIVAIANGQF